MHLSLWVVRKYAYLFRGEMVVLLQVHETHFEEFDLPRPKKHHDVEYRHSKLCVVDVILQIDWETNTSHADCGQLSIER